MLDPIAWIAVFLCYAAFRKAPLAGRVIAGGCATLALAVLAYGIRMHEGLFAGRVVPLGYYLAQFGGAFAIGAIMAGLVALLDGLLRRHPID